MGMKVGQVALRFGANDFGSLMMEENVVSAAGTTYRTTLSEMQRLIADAGYTPKKRKQDYTILEDAARDGRCPDSRRLRIRQKPDRARGRKPVQSPLRPPMSTGLPPRPSPT